jgi:hypothetical protein
MQMRCHNFILTHTQENSTCTLFRQKKNIPNFLKLKILGVRHFSPFLPTHPRILGIRDENGRSKINLKFCESQHHGPSKITKIWSGIIGFWNFMDCRCSFKVDKMNWESFSLKKIFKKKFEWEHPLWKTRKSLEKPGNLGFPGKFSSLRNVGCC